MRKTYITTMPDRAGAFLTATRVITECGGNMTRVNYNRAVDTHTLLIEVEAEPEQLDRISQRLKEVDYLLDDPVMRQIILIELILPDVPGALLPALEIINRHDVNIPYINSQANGTPFQNFKMGLLAENTAEIKRLLDELSQICEVHVLDYEASDRLLDSTIFYVTFANKLREQLGLSQSETNRSLVDANKVMQVVDQRDESLDEVFGEIQRFAQLVVDHKDGGFDARVTRRDLADGLTLWAVEPPMGGNAYALECHGSLLFVDCGPAFFQPEMVRLFDDVLDGFSGRRKSIVVTHPDIDSAGMLHLFDTIYLNGTSRANYLRENTGRPSFRERNPLHAPYNALTKILSHYQAPPVGRCVAVGSRTTDDPLELIATLRFDEWTFEIYEGAGGHSRGEAVITCPELKLAFTGDLLTNDATLTDTQKEYLALQPHIRATYDTNPTMAETIRSQLYRELAGYIICPGRGAIIG